MSNVKMPEPVVLRTVMPCDYRYGHVFGYTRGQMEAYAAARVREALETVKRGGPGKYSDVVSDGGMDPRNRPAPGAQEGA